MALIQSTKNISTQSSIIAKSTVHLLEVVKVVVVSTSILTTILLCERNFFDYSTILILLMFKPHSHYHTQYQLENLIEASMNLIDSNWIQSFEVMLPVLITWLLTYLTSNLLDQCVMPFQLVELSLGSFKKFEIVLELLFLVIAN